MPSAEHMPGIQSTNLMWTSDPFLAEWEYVEASMKKKKPRENYWIHSTLANIEPNIRRQMRIYRTNAPAR